MFLIFTKRNGFLSFGSIKYIYNSQQNFNRNNNYIIIIILYNITKILIYHSSIIYLLLFEIINNVDTPFFNLYSPLFYQQ